MRAVEVIGYGSRSGMRQHDLLTADLVFPSISGMVCFYSEMLFHKLGFVTVNRSNRRGNV
jgi:hypothetical protein